MITARWNSLKGNRRRVSEVMLYDGYMYTKKADKQNRIRLKSFKGV